MIVLVTPVAYATEIIGTTYPIAEEDLLHVIAKRLKQKEASGELASIEDRAKQQARAYIHRPPPVQTVTRATEPATRYYNPTITVPYAIQDAGGSVIHAAGTTVNPLDFITLRHTLLFFDSDDEQQVAWARQFVSAEEATVKLILVSGSPVELMEKLKVRVAFDQQGLLVNQLGIRHVPAMVYQEDKRLRIDEVAL